MNQNDLFEKMNSINNTGKSKKVDECKDCATRGNCQGRGVKCNDYVKDDIEPGTRNAQDEGQPELVVRQAEGANSFLLIFNENAMQKIKDLAEEEGENLERTINMLITGAFFGGGSVE